MNPDKTEEDYEILKQLHKQIETPEYVQYDEEDWKKWKEEHGNTVESFDKFLQHVQGITENKFSKNILNG